MSELLDNLSASPSTTDMQGLSRRHPADRGVWAVSADLAGPAAARPGWAVAVLILLVIGGALLKAAIVLVPLLALGDDVKASLMGA